MHNLLVIHTINICSVDNLSQLIRNKSIVLYATKTND